VIESGAHVADVGVVNGSVSIQDDVEMQGLSSVNGSVTIGRNARVSRSLSSVNGSLTVDQGSQVGGKVATVNGTISLRAVAVTEDVETNNGNILLSDGTTVDGDVRIKKSKWSWGGKRRQPKVVIGPNVVVRGAIDAEQPVRLWVHDSASVGEIRGATVQHYSGDAPPA
jgi:acyl-[acyl carrier protein]--UDP-N-acetylglucosamine O-acyltransferase